MARTFHVYVLKSSLDRTEPMYDKKTHCVRMAYNRKLRAESRTEAVQKALPQISNLIEAMTDPTIRFVSVFVGSGVTGKAERMTPIQIDVQTKAIRKA